MSRCDSPKTAPSPRVKTPSDGRVVAKLKTLLTLVRIRAVRAEGRAHAVHTYPLALPRAALGCSTTASPQQLQLTLEVPLLTLQRLQLVLALPVRLFKFLIGSKRRVKVNCGYQQL